MEENGEKKRGQNTNQIDAVTIKLEDVFRSLREEETKGLDWEFK